MIALADVPTRFPADRLALVHGDQRWTWGELDRRSAAWAAWLCQRGVVADDMVAFALPNGPEFMALSFGIYRAGATPAPISGKLPDFERDAILKVMQPRLFVGADVAPDGADVAPDGADVAPDGADVAPDGADVAPDGDDDAPDGVGSPPAPHIATSWKACTSGGSTGRPKVIVDGRMAGFAAGTDFIGIPEDSVVLVPGPLYHNASFSAAVFALFRGNAVVTMPRFDAAEALALIAAEHVAWSIMVPTMLHRLWKLPQPLRDSFDLSRWQMVVHTAAPMAPWLKHAWIDWLGPDHIWEVYGATEGLVRCWIGGREWLDRPGSVGKPIGGGRLRITDSNGHEVAVGAEGEVFAMPASGAGSTYRYIGAERRASADGWESVGDIGHVDADGYLYLADRRTDLIISGGVNIWPAEVEAAILRHPAVHSCAVIGRPHEDLGQSVHAIVETDDASFSLASLCSFLADYLARPKHPRSLAIQSTPVRDDAGKFRKSA